MPIQRSFFGLSRSLFVLVLVTVLVLFAGLLVSARTWITADVKTKPVAPPKTPRLSKGIQPYEEAQSPPQSQTATEQLEVELITVGPNGFEPSQINRPPGPFILLIQNRSGTDLGPLRLEAEESGRPTPASRIAEARIDRQRQDYGERLELPPGRYRLRQNDNSGWSFTIGIAPR